MPTPCLPPSRPDPERSIDEIDAAICRLASRVNAVNYRLLVLVREFDDRLGWAKWSFPSCAEWLSWRCGISLSAAREKVRTAQALRDLPGISLAFREGRLSYTKVRALTRVAAMHDEDSLVRYALDATAPQVEERCRQIRNVQPDSVHDARRAWERALVVGVAQCRARHAVLARGAAARGWRARHAGDRAGVGARGSRGRRCRERRPRASRASRPMRWWRSRRRISMAVRRESGSSSASTADRYQVVVHVDEAALHGGIGRADAPLETVKRLACDASVVVVTEDERGAPLSVGRKQRTVSTSIRRALWSRDRGCTFPGCHRTKFVDAHHVQHWVDGGETSVENLVLLCSHHHRLLHEGGYRIRRDYQGEYYFTRADGRAIPRCGYHAATAPTMTHREPSVEGCATGRRIPPWRCAKSAAFIACGRRATRLRI